MEFHLYRPYLQYGETDGVRQLSVGTGAQILVEPRGDVGADGDVGEHATQLARVFVAAHLLSVHATFTDCTAITTQQQKHSSAARSTLASSGIFLSHSDWNI